MRILIVLLLLTGCCPDKLPGPRGTIVATVHVQGHTVRRTRMVGRTPMVSSRKVPPSWSVVVRTKDGNVATERMVSCSRAIYESRPIGLQWPLENP